jgi:DNA-directed RNA polymerase subunit M/transcription elongation factor TFIIS
MIFWACPKCNSKLRAPETAIGRKLPCPKCQAENVVPSETISTTDSRPQSQPKAVVTSATIIQRGEPKASGGAIASSKRKRTLVLVLAGIFVSAAVSAAGYQFIAKPRQDETTIAKQEVRIHASEQSPVDIPQNGMVENDASPPPKSEPLPLAETQRPLTPASEFTLLDADEGQVIEATITIPDGYERPFKGLLQLKRGPKSPDGDFKVSADIGDCINGFLLTEPIETNWTNADRAPKTMEVKVFGIRWNQIVMARSGRTARGGVWKADSITQLILRNEELRNAGDAVWQLALMKIEPEGDFRSFRGQFANTPYEVSKTQWDFADQVLEGLRPVASEMDKEQEKQSQLAKEASAIRIPLVTAIREQRIEPTFQFPTLLKASFAIEYKLATDSINTRLEMWAPEAMRAVVEITPGQMATYYICDLQLSTAKASKHLQTGVHNWSGIAFSAKPIEPEPIIENSLHQQRTGAKKPQFGDVDPIVAHIAAQPNRNFVEKQLAIWIYNNPALSTDAIHAIGKKFDDPQLSTIPESIMDDARLQLRSSRWQVEQLPEELKQGRIEEFFVGEWKPADFLQARSAAVNFQLPTSLANPFIPASDIEEFRRQLTRSFGGGIDIEQMTLNLFPDLHFEARGTYLDRPVTSRGNWRWTGCGLDFPLWKDGKGNDPFLETGARANLPMLLLADKQVIGEPAAPSPPTNARGVFLRKTSSDPNTSVAQSSPTLPESNTTATTSKDALLDQALKKVELQNQALAIDAKNTRVLSLSSAIAEGLVTLSVDVVEPMPKSGDFMDKQGVVTVRRTPASKGLNLKLLSAAPMQFDFTTNGDNKVPIVLAYPRPEVLELPAIQSELKIRTRCFPLKWEGLNSLKPLENAIPHHPDPVISFLASSHNGPYLSVGNSQVQEFYGANWKKILNLREKEEKVFKANGLDQSTILKDRERWLTKHYFFNEVAVSLSQDENHSGREVATAILFLQNPTWKAEELLRYANSKAVKNSLGANGQEYLMKEFAPVPNPSLAMGGHGPNIRAFLMAKYCRDVVVSFSEALRSTPKPDDGISFFQGRWKSVSKVKALQLFEQITPRTIEEKNAKTDQNQRAAQGEPFSVGVLPVTVTLLPDSIYDLRETRAGVDEQSTGFWQWDGSQLWIGKSSYSLVDNCLVKVRGDHSNVYGSFLEREGDATPAELPIADAMPSESSTPAIEEQEAPIFSEADAVVSSPAQSKEAPKSLKPESIVGTWKPTERDRAVLVRAAIMRRQVDGIYGNAVKLNEEQQKFIDQLRSMAITEAAKDLNVPDVELLIDAKKTFRFKSNIKGREAEVSGKWSIKGGKLILEKDKNTRLELELVEGALYGETLQFGVLYLSKS